ncbi:flagellar type III secretion system protein FliQ, partial [bacterium]|nr:flagellar type III secretion system protein FliQ [bacterium]
LAAMAIGIIVSVLQAITQINEATLTFIPKIIAIVVVLLVMAPWMLEIMKQYSTDIFGNIHEWVR